MAMLSLSIFFFMYLSRSPLLEGAVALASYLTLSGRGFGTKGDGLIPTQAAVVDLQGQESAEIQVNREGVFFSGQLSYCEFFQPFSSTLQVIELAECNHAGFVPTPGASLQLPEAYEWYGSARQLPKWLPSLIKQ